MRDGPCVPRPVPHLVADTMKRWMGESMGSTWTVVNGYGFTGPWAAARPSVSSPRHSRTPRRRPGLARLDADGIISPSDLLAKAGEAAARKELAPRLGVGARELLEWVNRADLLRVEGITFELSDFLEDAGVDTVKELGTRRPDNLHKRLAEVAAAANRAAPTEAEVAAWVAQAKTLPQGVTH